ncbi:hypothetical protein [Burkholderia pseudomultivorans]|uniref:hypothetical protein n=1 Tax=Burkholderia pseudomultivorans TaxID=1207504 RepID=UPI001E34D627|nr:hypothetical protein [Burkholderia pseudomultivorans]
MSARWHRAALLRRRRPRKRFGVVSDSTLWLRPRQLNRISLKPETLFSHGLGRTLPNYGIDVAMNKFHAEMRSAAVFPPLAVTLNVRETSTIQR